MSLTQTLERFNWVASKGAVVHEASACYSFADCNRIVISDHTIVNESVAGTAGVTDCNRIIISDHTNSIVNESVAGTAGVTYCDCAMIGNCASVLKPKVSSVTYCDCAMIGNCTIISKADGPGVAVADNYCAIIGKCVAGIIAKEANISEAAVADNYCASVIIYDCATGL